ncbi:MAG: GC-type dockerin domain-anchored protein [Phycisphaerales bacterium JB054]
MMPDNKASRTPDPRKSPCGTSAHWYHSPWAAAVSRPPGENHHAPSFRCPRRPGRCGRRSARIAGPDHRPRSPARLDFDTLRLRGYAWAENIGWINLDDDEHFVAFYCPADFNNDGRVNTLDVLAFLNAWAARLPDGDFNHDGLINTLDVLAFLNAWAAGC